MTQTRQERQAAIFVVEDETLIRMMISEMVEELGHRVVAEAGSIREAQGMAETVEFDLALLDINVGGQSIAPIAEVIERRGLPFLFVIGYRSHDLPESFSERPLLRKPFAILRLKVAIEAVLS